MKVSDIHGWGTDADLMQLVADQPVRIEMINVYAPDTPIYELDDARIGTMRDLYRQYGPWALPPVVCLGDAGWQIAGLHRMWAAYHAGLEQLPAFIVGDEV